ncbi:hypothetical protein Mbo4_042 [Rhodococcus phage Mbo4]|uniref:Uncharacterized protein n=1 Tax=Rhodococcus phage Mbo4 TaxID=2936912 RepID=A0A9E7LA02_9CAUD|nr:hypothetical protein [Rhodococcus opacus]YP_010755947.1 hypothetical protein QEH50_gp42 [Rhodococcus phage Mbo4]URG17532.1 hypothetical protein Mbo4_042 [Rhodococcus phage Mbo4]
MRDIQRRAIDAMLDNKLDEERSPTGDITMDLLFTINDPALRPWLIAQRKWERSRIAEVA